jgi:hypothetical protein
MLCTHVWSVTTCVCMYVCMLYVNISLLHASICTYIHTQTVRVALSLFFLYLFDLKFRVFICIYMHIYMWTKWLVWYHVCVNESMSSSYMWIHVLLYAQLSFVCIFVHIRAYLHTCNLGLFSHKLVHLYSQEGKKSYSCVSAYAVMYYIRRGHRHIHD